MKKVILGLLTLFITTTSWARLTLPDSFENLQGAYKGKGLTSRKDAYLLVYTIIEEGQPSGKFNMFLLTKDRTQGQIIEAEWIGGTGIGIHVDNVNQTRRYINVPSEPAGILELSIDHSNGRVLKLSKQGNSPLEEEYVFTEDSDDIKVNPINPIGFFKNRDDSISITPGYTTNGKQSTINVDPQLQSLNLTGKYVGIFELEGVIVLRKLLLDNSFISYNELEISGILVSITNGHKPMIIVGGLSDGKPTPVRFLPFDNN